MNRTATTRDGTPVEIAATGTTLPPDSPPGLQHGNRSTVWWRVPGGEWRQSPERSKHGTILWIEGADDVAALEQGDES